jgi:hypothetical protein
VPYDFEQARVAAETAVAIRLYSTLRITQSRDFRILLRGFLRQFLF